MNKIAFCFLLLSSFLLASCSVVMSANSGGVDAETLSKCKTRSSLIADGAQPISHKTNKKGKLVSERFKAQMPTGSAARAAMHGVLDVATLGIWEVVGTPIEAIKDKKRFYIVQANYKPDGETINSIQLMS